LLDAAHIIADKDERFGQLVIPNGIPLSKIHHAAFDAHLIGIDPNILRVLLRKPANCSEADRGRNCGCLTRGRIS